jgi:hypothetical protein
MIPIHSRSAIIVHVCLFWIGLAGPLTNARVQAQGTITFTFEGTPHGIETQFGANPYSTQSGMEFGPTTPQSLYLSGGGIPGYADNGTGHLELPGGAMDFGYNASAGFFPLIPFDLLSFDAAEYHAFPGSTITVVGYHPMAGTVTNLFVLDGVNDGPGGQADFQTFHLDSGFQNVFRVDVIGRLALDNVVISGVPEPTAGSLALLGGLCGAAWHAARRQRTPAQSTRFKRKPSPKSSSTC